MIFTKALKISPIRVRVARINSNCAAQNSLMCTFSRLQWSGHYGIENKLQWVLDVVPQAHKLEKWWLSSLSKSVCRKPASNRFKLRILWVFVMSVEETRSIHTAKIRFISWPASTWWLIKTAKPTAKNSPLSSVVLSNKFRGSRMHSHRQVEKA